MTVLNFTIFAEERRWLLRAMLKKIFVNNAEFNSLIEMSQVNILMHGYSCLIKSIFFEMEKIKLSLILQKNCGFERNWFDLFMALGMNFINESLKSLFAFRIKLYIISIIIFNWWRFNFNKTLFIFFDFLLNLLVLLFVFKFDSFLLLLGYISFLLFSTVDFSQFFQFPLVFFTYLSHFFILNLILLLFDHLINFILGYLNSFLLLSNFLFLAHFLYQLLLNYNNQKLRGENFIQKFILISNTCNFIHINLFNSFLSLVNFLSHKC